MENRRRRKTVRRQILESNASHSAFLVEDRSNGVEKKGGRKKGKERKEEKRKIASSIVKLVHVVAIAGLGRLCWFRRSNFKTRGKAREKFSIAFESSPRFPKYSQSWKRVGKKFWFGFLFFAVYLSRRKITSL